jgi:hypothetical protein
LTAEEAVVARGAASRAPANPVVIIDTLEAGVTVTLGEVSPEVVVRDQAERRRPAPPALS